MDWPCNKNLECKVPELKLHYVLQAVVRKPLIVCLTQRRITRGHRWHFHIVSCMFLRVHSHKVHISSTQGTGYGMAPPVQTHFKVFGPPVSAGTTRTTFSVEFAMKITKGGMPDRKVRLVRLINWVQTFSTQSF